jgi:hypothetical protein
MIFEPLKPLRPRLADASLSLQLFRVLSCSRRGFRPSSRATTPSIDALGRARIIRESRVLLAFLLHFVRTRAASRARSARSAPERFHVGQHAEARGQLAAEILGDSPRRVFLAKGQTSARQRAERWRSSLSSFTPLFLPPLLLFSVNGRQRTSKGPRGAPRGGRGERNYLPKALPSRLHKDPCSGFVHLGARTCPSFTTPEFFLRS